MGVTEESHANGEAVELEDIDVTDAAPAGMIIKGVLMHLVDFFAIFTRL